MKKIEKYKSPPRTAMEVFDLLPEGTIVDVIDNRLYVYPTASFYHQELLGNLLYKIHEQNKSSKLGGTMVSWVDVYLDDMNAVQPDILFISAENMGIIQDEKIKGAPDLIIEVMEEEEKHELLEKKLLFEKFGVKEYFIVNRLNNEVITYYHDNGKFILQESKNGKVKSKILKKTFSF